MFVNRLPFYSPKILRTLMVVTALLCSLAAIGLKPGKASAVNDKTNSSSNKSDKATKSRQNIPIARRAKAGRCR